MAMTINQLHKLTGELIEQGFKRTKVSIDKSTFTHALEEDGCLVLDVEGAEIKRVLTADDDGGIKYNKDGSESSKTILVLNGGDSDNY